MRLRLKVIRVGFGYNFLHQHAEVVSCFISGQIIRCGNTLETNIVTGKMDVKGMWMWMTQRDIVIYLTCLRFVKSDLLLWLFETEKVNVSDIYQYYVEYQEKSIVSINDRMNKIPERHQSDSGMSSALPKIYLSELSQLSSALKVQLVSETGVKAEGESLC